MAQHLAALALLVRDYDEAIAYYVGTLGFTLVEDTDMGRGKRFVRVMPPGPGEGPGGCALLLAKAASPAQESHIGNQTGGRVFLFLHTDDFARDHAAYAAKGVRFIERRATRAYGTVVVFEDLYGNRWDLVQPKTA